MPNTMADAEKKSLRKYKIIMALISVLLFSMSYFGLFGTYLYYWHKQTSSVTSALGIACYAASFLPLVFQAQIRDKLTSEGAFYIFWFIGIGLGLLVSCGFNFTLP